MNSADEVLKLTEIRKLPLFFLVIFNPDNCMMRTWTYVDSREVLDIVCDMRAKQSKLFPTTFSQTLFMTPGHPLYHLGVPVKSTHEFLK